VSNLPPPQFTHGGIAETYQRFFVPLIPAPLARELVERASPRAGERIADVACGTGVVTRLAAEHVGAEGTAAGIDSSAEMLDVARSLPAPPGARIEWHQAKAEGLPLADNCVDIVFCQLGLMLVGDRMAAVREMHRVLTPNGRIALNVPGTIPPPLAIMAQALARHVDRALSGFVGAVFSMHEPSEIQRLLHDGGFADVAVETVTRAFRLGPPEEFLWGYITSTPLCVAVADADPKKLEQVRDDVVAAWQPFSDDNSLTVDQPIIVATARAR
jgi:ubiquinone/menaquinone biosynthesis C-methylase UbiE